MKRSILLGAVLGCAALAAACGNNTNTNGAGNSPTPSGTGPTPTPTGSAQMCTSTGGSVDKTGGTVDCLTFAIIGDTRPATMDDNSGYPKSIITKIYQDIQAENPRPHFGISTGDYQYSGTSTNNAATQIGYYMTAQSGYSNVVFHAMGNHECTGYTSSNCGSGNTDGITNNYTAFMNAMVTPLGQSKPYYSVNVKASDNSWTAKFVFIAANAWDSTQASWLTSVMQQSTTYTFVVRHEDIYANTAPGVTPSQNIIKNYPYTFLLEGHSHELKYYSSDKEIIVGIGGAPLTSSSNYGYVTVEQRADGNLVFTGKDYQTGATLTHFVITKDGSQTS